MFVLSGCANDGLEAAQGRTGDVASDRSVGSDRLADDRGQRGYDRDPARRRDDLHLQRLENNRDNR
jgi:hypothetical protein